jgi:hypothetical protein
MLIALPRPAFFLALAETASLMHIYWVGAINIARAPDIGDNRLIFKGVMVLPTGNLLKAGRALAGLRSGQLARLAEIDPSTLSRLEAFGSKPVRGQAPNIDAIISQLKARGVEITEDGVRLISKKPKR